jgi:(S)-2-hydroxy-acid oxidase
MNSLDLYERRALQILPESIRDYYRSGAGNENSLSWNREDFNNFRIRPRFLKDVTERDMRLNVFGANPSFPCGISPTAMQRMAHPDGELSSVRGKDGVCALYLTVFTYAEFEEFLSHYFGFLKQI